MRKLPGQGWRTPPPPCEHPKGYRGLHILLHREGNALNHKSCTGCMLRKRLQVRRRRGGKRALGRRATVMLPQGANQR
jgi:putative transposase